MFPFPFPSIMDESTYIQSRSDDAAHVDPDSKHSSSSSWEVDISVEVIPDPQMQQQTQSQAQISSLQQQNALLNQELATQAASHIQLQQLLQPSIPNPPSSSPTSLLHRLLHHQNLHNQRFHLK